MTRKYENETSGSISRKPEWLEVYQQKIRQGIRYLKTHKNNPL